MHYDSDLATVKKPNDISHMTLEEKKEFIKCAFDIEYWAANYVFVQSGRGSVKFEARSYQTKMWEAYRTNRMSITLCPRQAGKTITAAIDLLHEAIFFKDIRAGVTSYKLDNVKDVMERIKYAYECLPFWMKPAVTTYNQFKIAFENKSSIQGEVTKGNTFRGKSMTTILADELAHVKPSIAEEWWTALLPSLEADGEASETRLIIISTANGTAGKFAEIWFKAKHGQNGFFPLEVNPAEIPGRTEKFKRDMLKKMNKNKYYQEYENAFISDKGTLIDSEIIEAMQEVEPVLEVTDDLWFWEEDLTGKVIAIACDVGQGVGKDYHGVQIVDVGKFEQVGEFRNNSMQQTVYAKEIIKIIRLCYDMGAKEVYYTIENNSIGLGILSLIESSDDDVIDEATLITHYDSKLPGMPMNRKTKPLGCQYLKDMIELDKFTVKSSRLINEFKFFVKRGETFKAEEGLTDDLVMAMVNMALMLKELADFEDSAYDRLGELEVTDDDYFTVGIF